MPSDSHARPDPAAPGAQRLESSGFLWPPSPLPRPDNPTPSARLPSVAKADPLRAGFAAALTRPLTTSTRVLDACEDRWLDLCTPSLARRVAATGWSPDLPGDYCPRCGISAGPMPVDALGCSRCASRRLPYERIIRLGPFEGLLRDTVHEVKFEQQRVTGRRLGQLLGLAIRHELEHAGITSDRVVLIPLPTTFRRRMHRGIDHTLLLARSVHQVTGGVIARPIHKRHRPSQVEVNPSDREANMARAFRPGRLPVRLFSRAWVPLDLSGKVAIVLDDVTTTGATLRGACRATLAAWREASRGEGFAGPGARTSPRDRPRIWAAVLGVTPAADGDQGGPPREDPGPSGPTEGAGRGEAGRQVFG